MRERDRELGMGREGGVSRDSREKVGEEKSRERGRVRSDLDSIISWIWIQSFLALLSLCFWERRLLQLDPHALGRTPLLTIHQDCVGYVLKDWLEEKVNAAQAQKTNVHQRKIEVPLSPSKASLLGFPGGSMVQNPPANVGDLGLIPGLGRPPGGGNSNLLQYSCLGNPMDRRARWVMVHGVTKEIRLSN